MAPTSNSSIQGLKPSVNQVGGHRFDEGHQGSLVDDSGKFYKPLQGGDRGHKEAQFYEILWSDESVPAEAKKFFPKFFGTVSVPADGEAEPSQYAVMEDLTKGFQEPCIADIKMGKQTWYEEASEKYIQKCLEKDASTTSSTLGFRLAGMQVYDQTQKKTWKADRNWCRDQTPESMTAALERYVSTAPFDENSPVDSDLAHLVYGKVLEHLKDLRSWFEKQTRYHFYSASILIIYDGDVNASGINSRNVTLRLVDFAHVVEGHGVVDSNFLLAIDSVCDFFTRIIKASE